MAKHRIEERPNYYYGQLLKEEDFLAEQEFHIRARENHNRHLHGSGIVYGLEVEPSGDTAVSISPGLAIDERGREIRLRDSAVLDLSKFAEKTVLTISVHYEDDKPEKESNRRSAYAVLGAIPQGEMVPGLVLAVVQLDERAKVRGSAINPSSRKFASVTLAPGTVTAISLESRLRVGWLKVPFRPIPLDKDPEDKRELPPPFRVGATEARSHSEINGEKNTRGAGGTMAIPVPPGVRKVMRFRIAGENNAEGIELRLVLGGWDAQKQEHVRKDLVDARRDANTHIRAGKANQAGKTPYDSLYEVKEGDLDLECSTLSLWLRGFGKTSVSLVAVEFSY